MPYTTGTILATTTPASALVTGIETQLTNHTGWSFIEEVVIGTYTYRVWRADLNTFGTPFHIALRRLTDGTGEVAVKCFESWDGVNKKAIRPVTPSGSNQAANATTFAFGDETLGFTLDAVQVVPAWVATSTSDFAWGLQLTADRLVLWTGFSTTDNSVYAGLFDSLMASDPFPLMMSGTSGAEGILYTDTGVSRHPNLPTLSNTYNFVFQLGGWTPQGGDLGGVRDAFHASAVPSRVLLYPYTGPHSAYGYLRGLLKDCLYIPHGSAAPRNGDTLTIGTDVYIRANFGTYRLPSVWVRRDA